MYDKRLDKLADVMVGYSLGVKKGESVMIKGSTAGEPLVVAVCKRVLKAGGNPVVRCYPDEIEELICGMGDSKQIGFISPGDKKDIDTTDCYVGVWGSDNTRSMSNIDPLKQQARSKARKPILNKMLKRSALTGPKKLRWVGTQYPCQASAQDADMSLSDYAEFVFAAGLLHLPNPAAAWRKIHVAQQRLCERLSKAKEIRFMTRTGTNIRMSVAGRKWINCSGQNNFPDGEVFTGPVEDSAEGTVCFTYPAVYGGREVVDVRLEFKNGKVVDASANRNEDYLYKMIEQDRGAKFLGEVALGTNYSIKRFTRNTLFDEKIGGTFHLALGASYPETGGKNDSGLHWDMVCDLHKGGIVEVDGKVISRNGRFVNKSWPQPGRGK